jgi:hypothetical protein
MGRKGPLWQPAGLRCSPLRGFSDSFSRETVRKGVRAVLRVRVRLIYGGRKEPKRHLRQFVRLAVGASGTFRTVSEGAFSEVRIQDPV